MSALVALTKQGGLSEQKRGELAAIREKLKQKGLIPEFGHGYCYLLLDHSTSMEKGEKMARAKNGAESFTEDAMEKGYSVGLIKFGTTASHVCELIKDVEILNHHIRGIGICGTTNMAHSIQIAREKLRDKKGSRVIVLVTDGDPDSRDATISEADLAKEEGIDIITIGTDDADEGFLKKLASRTELGIKVSRQEFGKGIEAAAKKLPLLTY